MLGISTQTLRNWDKSGKLSPHHKGKSGYRYYSIEQIESISNYKHDDRVNIGYCRVSSIKKKAELDAQIYNVKQYLLSKGQPFEIISEISSETEHKKNLKKILDRITNGQVRKVVVPNKYCIDNDELLLREWELHGCKIEVIDNTETYPHNLIAEDCSDEDRAYKYFKLLIDGKTDKEVKAIISSILKEAEKLTKNQRENL